MVTDDTCEPARAKVNLALHVLDRRADSYHAIESLVVFADVGDTVSAGATPDTAGGLALEGPFAPDLVSATAPEQNLAMRAAAALASTVGGSRPFHLTLTKRLPIAAGLGGGSADAAAVLRLLDRVWGLHLGEVRLAELALRLGADVPMCLTQRPLVARGIGERVSPIMDVPPLPLVLACPRLTVPTAKVFAALGGDRQRAPLPALPQRFSSAADVAAWLRLTRNDLGKPATEVCTQADAAEQALARDTECLFARMSGSGAAAFGLFATRDGAERAARRLRAAHPDWWAVATRSGAS